MAITATFKADFSTFTSAVEKAEVSLKDLESGASTAGKSLDRMSAQFSGKKIIQEATLMAKAIGDAGNLTKLTESELKRVAATANEAAAKLKALGREVPPGIQNLADATKNVGTAAKSSTSLLSGLAGQLAGMFTVGAVIGFGREILNAGDAIQKMADQTGLSVEEVQKLQHIAGQSGTSIESLVSAIQNLQQRLGDDNSGAVGAIKKLGINFKEFQQQGTYQQMVTLADAIKNIENPTEQASAAAAIFGKNWKEILPAIKSGMRDVGEEAALMSDETVKALDRIGDAFTKGKSIAIVFGAGLVTAIEKAGFALGDFLSRFNPEHFGVATSQILKMQAALNDPTGLNGAMAKAQQAAAKLAKTVGADLKPVVAATWQEEQRFNQQLEASIEANKKAAQEAKQHADAMARLNDRLRELTHRGTELPDFHQILNLGKYAGETLERVGQLTDFVSQHKGDLFPEPPASTLDAWKKMQKGITETMPIMLKLKDVAKTSIGGLNDIFQRAFEGGGGVGGAIKSFATNALGGLLKMIPVVGGVLSQFAGTIVAAFSKIFGKSEESSKVSPVRDEFFKLAGGLDVLNEKAMKASGSLALVQAIFNAKTVEQYNKAIQDLNNAFAFQDQALKTLDETAKKYGFTIEELGPAWQRQELDKKAQELFKDYQILTSAGVDHTKVLEKMSKSVNEYVQNALKMGLEVPMAMKPMLEAMVRNGQLVDANGNKIESLEDAGVKFSMTMTEGFKALIKEVENLTNVIARSLGLSLDDARRKADVASEAMQDGFDDARRSAEKLSDEIDGISYGHSPGGLKDIITMSSKAGAALMKFGKDAGGLLAKAGKDVDNLAKKLGGLKPPAGWTGAAKDAYTDIARELALLRAPTEFERDKLQLKFDLEDQIASLSADKKTLGGAYATLVEMAREVYRLRLSELTAAEMARRSEGFSSGTHGQYLDFGQGTLAMLHGRERVMTAAEGAAESGGWSALKDEMAAIRRELANRDRSLRQGLKDILLDPAVLAAAAR